MTGAPQNPNDAIEALGTIFRNQPVLIDPLFVAEDLLSLRQAFPDDAEFASAVIAVGKAVVQACTKGTAFGTDLIYQLQTWYRASFPSQPRMKRKADLRLVFRPGENGKMEILAFGHRQRPRAVYLTAKTRLPTSTAEQEDHER